MKLSEKYIGNNGFTLLELLAVMLIMFMLMGMGTVAMKGLVRGSGASGAFSNVRSVLTQARQYAITKEQPVYVIFDKSDEKSSMKVCAEYAVVKDSTTSFVVTEDPLPWGTNTLNGGVIYNLRNGRSGSITRNTREDKIICANLGWSKGDSIGFEVADVRYLPSGMEFTDASANETIIFNADGTAGGGSGSYTIEFQEMYVQDPIAHSLDVDKLTGWIKKKD